jgi:hypothetical protein
MVLKVSHQHCHLVKTGGENNGSPSVRCHNTVPDEPIKANKLPSSQAIKIVSYEPKVIARTKGALVPLFNIVDQTRLPDTEPFAKKTIPPSVPATTLPLGKTTGSSTNSSC